MITDTITDQFIAVLNGPQLSFSATVLQIEAGSDVLSQPGMSASPAALNKKTVCAQHLAAKILQTKGSLTHILL